MRHLLYGLLAYSRLSARELCVYAYVQSCRYNATWMQQENLTVYNEDGVKGSTVPFVLSDSNPQIPHSTPAWNTFGFI